MLKRSFLLVVAILISFPSWGYAQVDTQKYTFLITLKTVGGSQPITLLDAWTAFGFDRRWSQLDGTMPAGIDAKEVFLSGKPGSQGPSNGPYRPDMQMSPNASGALIIGGQIIIPPARELVHTDLLTKAITEKCQAVIAPDNSMPQDQRTARIKQLDEQIAQLNQQASALNVLAGAYMQNGPADQRLGERIKQLRAESQRLETELFAKEARRKALQEGIQVQEKRLQEQQQMDAIVGELRKIQGVREQELARMRDLHKAGTVSDSQILAAENAVTEARIRVLEREGLIGKSGKGELVDRMADETAMIAVDITELAIKRGMVKSQLDSLNPAAIGGGNIDQALKDNPELRAENSQAMLAEVEQKQDAAKRERFALLVSEVTVTVTKDPFEGH